MAANVIEKQTNQYEYPKNTIEAEETNARIKHIFQTNDDFERVTYIFL